MRRVPYERFTAGVYSGAIPAVPVVCSLKILGSVPDSASGMNRVAIAAELWWFVGAKPTAPVDSCKEP